MDLKGNSTVGGKRIATIDDIMKLEAMIASSGGIGGGGGGTPGGDWIPGEEGLPTYKIEIWSSAGDRFRNGKIDTWLEARVYRGARDVTDLVIDRPEYRFSWLRLSGNDAADLAWANNRLANHKQHITKADVPADRCTFRCRLVDITTNTVVLQS